jgi:hypothetical protein
MHLTFEHDPRGECFTRIRRADGADGIFGCIAAGAVFSSMRQTAGKKCHDAEIRTSRTLKAANSIGMSEAITSVIHKTVEKSSAD